MSDFSNASDEEYPIFYERRTQEKPNDTNINDNQSFSETDSEIMILSNHDKGIAKNSQDKNDNNLSNETFINDNFNHNPPDTDDSDSDSDIQICSSPINHNFPSFLENLSSSQPSSLSLEPIKRQENSQPTILSVGSGSDSETSDKSDLPDLNFDHVRKVNYSQNSQELFNFSFPFNKNRGTQSHESNQEKQNHQDITYPQMTAATKEAEQIFRTRISKARNNFVNDVLKAIKELNAPIPLDVDVSRPPAYESMNDDQLAHELANFGFRFKTREDAISKLFRCWAAVREKEAHQTNDISGNDVSSNSNQRDYSNLNPIDFIRLHSKFYEQILIYQPIPLASLYREMTEAKIKISVSRLKSILDDEGVAFSDDVNAIYPTK